MKKLVKFVCFIFLLSMVGCSRINIPFFGKPSDQVKINKQLNRQAQDLVSTKFVDEGHIVNAKKLQQGRTIAIIPFTAGVGAESTDELNRVALMIIKGVTDAFADDRTGKHAHFKVLMAERFKEADLIVGGHITSMLKPSKIKKWMPLSNNRKLSVEGKITDKRSGETVVLFTDQIEAKANDADYKQLGYNIGKDIGQFILSGIN